MNVEQSYIKYNETADIEKIIRNRLTGEKYVPKENVDFGVPNSYQVLLAEEPKRKVAISKPSNSWISVLESKEVNDYEMLLFISKELNTKILSIIQSDVTGTWGYVQMENGKVVSSYIGEDDDVEYLIEKELEENGITTPIYMFREVVRDNNWKILDRKGYDI